MVKGWKSGAQAQDEQNPEPDGFTLDLSTRSRKIIRGHHTPIPGCPIRMNPVLERLGGGLALEKICQVEGFGDENLSIQNSQAAGTMP